MARPLKPLVKSGGYYPSNRWTPLVYPGGYTTANGGGKPEPEAVLKTVTGSLIHITDALARPAEALSVNVEPIQDLHGYDSPWPAGGGKNLFNVDRTEGTPNPAETSATPRVMDTGHYYVGITRNNYYSPNQVTDYSVTNGVVTVTANAGGYGIGFPVSVAENKTYVVSYENLSNGKISVGFYDTDWNFISHIDNITYFTTPADTAYASLVVTPVNYQLGACSVKNIQLESGSTASSYTPYSNICPISGRTSATVTRTGRNLFDKSTGIQFTYNNVLVARSQGFGVPFKFKKGVTYTISCNGTTIPSAIYIIEPYTSTVITQVSANYSISFTPSADTEGGMNFYWSSAHGGRPTDATDIMVEVGSVKHDFEPYAGNTYTIQLGDTVYGGTLDVTTGKLTVDRAYALLNDAAGWRESTGTVDFIYYAETFGNRKKYANSYDGLVCSYMVVSGAGQNTLTARWTGATSNMFGLRWVDGSIDQVKADAQAGKIAICYELATPIVYDLTPTQIEMLLGENNLWSDAGDSTLTYYAEGEASTSEALGILLGGTYNNPGGADDVSDDEALGILLGGT